MRKNKRGIKLVLTALLALFAAPLSLAGDIDFSQGQWYEAALLIDDEPGVVFIVWLPSGQSDAIIRNGDEDIRVDFSRTNDSIVLDFPHYDSRIEATQTDDGFAGEWRKQRSDGVASMPFRLIPTTSGDLVKIPDRAKDVWKLIEPAPELFRYEIQFEKSGLALATIRLPGRAMETKAGIGPTLHEALGTIETPTGDYRFLAGFFSSHGGFLLSTFDGAHAFNIQANPSPGDALLHGNFYSGNWWHEAFTARRLGPDEEFELPDPFSEVALTSGDGTLNIEALDKPRYQGRPVIVQIFGTWCPNCHDETPVLRDLYERYRGDGLQVLGLAYEVTGDDARSQRQVERFKKKFGIDWEIEIAGTSDKAQASKTLPDITAVKSFPTTIWIGRDGNVRAIHSGFSGPATGDEHVELVAEFETLTAEIVGKE